MLDWNRYLDIKTKYAENENKQKCILFVFLYMQLNSYCNDKYGVKTSDHTKMVNKLSDNPKLKITYSLNNISQEFISSFSKILLNGQQRKYVINMKNSKQVKYDNTYNQLEHFLGVIYQIRCNMFHGSKCPITDNDLKLISWAYDCLNKLVEESDILNI